MGDLIAGWMQDGKVRLEKFVRNGNLRKSLIQNGIPLKDARIVEFSAGSGVSVIVSQDIDLFEPKRKGCNSEERKKLIHDRAGKICRMIEKTLEIYVVCCCRVDEFLPEID